jgi:hypothetical protein
MLNFRLSPLLRTGVTVLDLICLSTQPLHAAEQLGTSVTGRWKLTAVLDAPSQSLTLSGITAGVEAQHASLKPRSVQDACQVREVLTQCFRALMYAQAGNVLRDRVLTR